MIEYDNLGRLIFFDFSYFICGRGKQDNDDVTVGDMIDHDNLIHFTFFSFSFFERGDRKMMTTSQWKR